MEATITLRECLDFMDGGLIFSLKFAQYDKKRKKSWGKFAQYGEAMLLQKDKDFVPSVTEKPTNVGFSVMGEENTKLHAPRNPNHVRHMTRNIRICIGKKPINKIVKIHLDLLVRFNGRKVILP